MTVKRRKLSKGIRIKPNDQALEADGEITVDSSVVGEEGEQTLKAQLSSAEKVIVTKDQAQTLENKTIDATSATGNNTLSADSGDIVYDDTTQPVSSLGTDVQSALDAVKVALDGQNEASEIGYTPTTGADWVDPDPTNVKGALDQAASRITQNESDISTNGTAISDHLADTVDAHDASAISNVPAGNLAATDVQGALDELQSDVDTRALANLGTITNASIQTPSRLDTKQDTEANLITYALTASDGQFVFATDTQKMYQIIDNELAAVGGGGATAFEINQVAHGFAIGEGVYHNGTTWVKAQADDADTLAYFAIVEVIDVDNFVAADFGRIEVPAHGYTVGEFYFQSDSVAGQATNVEPSSFSNPLFFVEDANTLQVKVYRPAVVGQDVILDELSDVSVPSPTDGQALIYDNGTSTWKAQDVAGTAADITYDNSTSGLTATDSQAAIDEVEGRVDTLESATTALDDLSDVSVASPNDGEVLTYNSISGDWESTKAATSQVNYIENNDFEVDTTGWTGDTNLVISRITSGQLRGAGSLQIAKAAADASGEQVYVDFTVDTADLAKKLIISFDIDASDANYSDDDMKVKIIKDPSGTPVDIAVNGQEIKGGKFQYIGQFQTDATITDYRLVIEQVSTQASAVNLVIDNVSVGPREVAIGPTMTDWEDFNMVIDAQTSAPVKGTILKDEARYRRVGDSIEIQIDYQQSTAGSSGSGAYLIEIPDSLEADLNKVGSSGAYISGVIGQGILNSSGGVEIPVKFVTYEADPNKIVVQIQGNSGSTIQYSHTAWGGTYYGLGNANIGVTGRLSIPIVGWSSNAKMSEDFGGRDVVVEATPSTFQDIFDSTATVLNYDTIYQDTTTSFDGSRFTAPETGRYNVYISQRILIGNDFNGTTERLFINLLKNGGSVNKDIYRIYNDIPASGQLGTEIYPSGSVTLDLEKGDYIEVDVTQLSGVGVRFSNGGADFSKLEITKLASPQTILETETVAARYTSNAGTNISPSTYQILKYEDIDFDTHSMYDTSTGILTIPTTGKYNISSKAMLSGLNADQGEMSLAIYVNGTKIDENYNYIGRGSLESRQVVTTLDLTKSDEVTIRLYQTNGAGRVQFNQNSYNTFSIARIK